jgi:GAF domain-containing protein
MYCGEEPSMDDSEHAAAPEDDGAAHDPDGLRLLLIGESEQQDADLATSLSELSQLSAGRFGLVDLLTKVATMAVQAIPGADGAGLTLLEPHRADIIVKSTDFVREIDDIQYSIGQGPCISAAQTGTTMRSGSLGGDQRWPRFGPRAGRLGVHSVLSLPLVTPGGVVGAMNVYAHAKDAFDERAEELGELFAVPAAVSVLNAQILSQSQRLATQLQAALISRPVIDQAIGILRSRSGDTAAEAFARLQQMSQHEHLKLTAVATAVVEEAAARARVRHAQNN